MTTIIYIIGYIVAFPFICRWFYRAVGEESGDSLDRYASVGVGTIASLLWFIVPFIILGYLLIVKLTPLILDGELPKWLHR